MVRNAFKILSLTIFLTAATSSLARANDSCLEFYQNSVENRQGAETLSDLQTRLQILRDENDRNSYLVIKPDGTGFLRIIDSVYAEDGALIKLITQAVKAGYLSEIHVEYIYGPKVPNLLVHLLKSAPLGKLLIYGKLGITHINQKYQEQTASWHRPKSRGEIWTESQKRAYADFLEQSGVLEARDHLCEYGKCNLYFVLESPTLSGFRWSKKAFKQIPY